MLFAKKKKLTEEQLLLGCQKGNREICNMLYQELAPYMKAVCKRYVIEQQTAEDIMHDAFIKVFAEVGSFTWKGEGTFRAWVVRIMINASIDYLKQTAKRNEHNYNDSFDIAESFDDNNDDDESLLGMVKQKGIGRDELMEMLETLPETTRLVFNLYAIEQLKHKDIANILGIAEEASRTRLKRARIQLREKLAIRCNYKDKTLVS